MPRPDGLRRKNDQAPMRGGVVAGEPSATSNVAPPAVWPRVPVRPIESRPCLSHRARRPPCNRRPSRRSSLTSRHQFRDWARVLLPAQHLQYSMAPRTSPAIPSTCCVTTSRRFDRQQPVSLLRAHRDRRLHHRDAPATQDGTFVLWTKVQHDPGPTRTKFPERNPLLTTANGGETMAPQFPAFHGQDKAAARVRWLPP
jgi:hypothetical protein